MGQFTDKFSSMSILYAVLRPSFIDDAFGIKQFFFVNCNEFCTHCNCNAVHVLVSLW